MDKADERSALIEQIVDTNDRLMRALGRLHAADVLGIGITMAQVKVLYLVGPGEGLSMSHLASALGVTLPTVSGLVDRLVDAGYAGRHDEPADRRQVVVFRTATGSSLVERFHDLSRPLLEQLLHTLSDRDLKVVARALIILTSPATDLAEASAGSGTVAPRRPAAARRALPRPTAEPTISTTARSTQ